MSAPSKPLWMRPPICRFSLEIGEMSAAGAIVINMSISLGCFFLVQIEPIRAMRVMVSSLIALSKNHFAASSNAPRSVLLLGSGMGIVAMPLFSTSTTGTNCLTLCSIRDKREGTISLLLADLSALSFCHSASMSCPFAQAMNFTVGNSIFKRLKNRSSSPNK